MTFASAILIKTIWGNKKVRIGTFTNGSGDIGGDVATGLYRVDAFGILALSGTSTAGTAPQVNETFPLAGGDVTIATADNLDGWWIAIGW